MRRTGCIGSRAKASNHGLKDVAALAETLIEASRLGLDIGSLNVLKRYERWRRFDSVTSAMSGAAINTLFSNDNIALQLAAQHRPAHGGPARPAQNLLHERGRLA